MKVFGIGLSRTGTTSLNEALQILGWRSIHYPLDVTISDAIHKTLSCAEKYEAVTDIPAALAWRDLSRRYPKAKFILTVRDEEAWIDSCRRWWGRKHVSALSFLERSYRVAMYGQAGFDEEVFRSVYKKHFTDVVSTLGDRVLVLDICSGCNWFDLCNFLEVEVPNVDFPVSHVWKRDQ